jgi:hypothetical protein
MNNLTEEEVAFAKQLLIEQAFDRFSVADCNRTLRNMVIRAASKGKEERSLIFMGVEYKITVVKK